MDPSSDADTCLDTAAMAVLLGRALGRPVAALRLADVRRNTSRQRNPHPLTLCYEVDLDGPAGPETCRLTARLCRDAASAAAERAALPGAPALLLPELPLLLWRFPADPGLPQLPALLDLDQARPWCGAAANAVAVLRHVAGHRAALRYSLPQPLRGGLTSDPAAPADGAGGLQLYAKTFSDDRGAAIERRFQHFWQQSLQHPGAPRVARTLGYSADTRTLWQAAAPGRPLAPLIDGGWHDHPGLPTQVARAWAAVHGAPLHLAGPSPRDRAHWLTELTRRCKKLGRAQPALAGPAARLRDTLFAASAALPEPPPRLVHGDCHPDQLWWHGHRVVLFDFDEFQLGDPMEDLAEFITKLAPQGPPAAFATALLSAYQAEAPALFSQPRLRWHAAVQQLLQAARAFGFQRPGWPQEMAARLARAQALADAALADPT